jgi:ABC-type transporter MlaC component
MPRAASLPHRPALAAFLAFVMALVLLPLRAEAASCPASSMIISAGRTYDAAARAGSASAFSAGVSRYSDMHSVAMFALGRYRKLLPASREKEYVSLTRGFMGRFMLEHGKDLRVGTLEIVSCKGPPSNTTVSARTSSGDNIVFKVYRSRSGWLIRDMKVSGIWLVQQMRSAFVGTISRSKGNIDELFKFIRA